MVASNIYPSLDEISQGRLFMYSGIFMFLSNILFDKEHIPELKNALIAFDENLYNLLIKIDKEKTSKLCLTEFDIDIKPSEIPVIVSNIKEYFYYENHDFYLKDKPDHILNYLYYMVSKISNLLDHISHNRKDYIKSNIKYQLRFLNVHFFPFLSKKSSSEEINMLLDYIYSLLKKDYDLIKDYYISVLKSEDANEVC